MPHGQLLDELEPSSFMNGAAQLRKMQSFADELAARPNRGETSAPLAELERMASMGLLAAPLPVAYGGLGLADSSSSLPLLQILAAVGSGDLALGRLYEGHVNAIALIANYGTPDQIRQAAEDAHAGLLFGVWNTGARDLLRLEGGPGSFMLKGVKTFASGAAFVQRPIITAELQGGGWQMILLPMNSPEVAPCIRIDRSFWHPLGMEASESYGVDFTGAAVSATDLIGKPGDFYRDPLFRGGAIRFAAVQAGAILRLHRLFIEHLKRNGRGGDPYQIARLGEIAIGAQEAVLWIERAAETAARCLSIAADKPSTARMIECANMTRIAIEKIATATIARVAAGVGAHGLLQPSRFERILRDLTMYLRQPAPDQTLADVGRASLEENNHHHEEYANRFWKETPSGSNSLSPAYFEHIYEQSTDPWDFESSEYEAAKYRNTLASLPADRYRNALEIGCSIGVLTAQLAGRCGHLLSLDVSERALEIARTRCASLPQVEFRRMEVPREMPEGCFDLVMLSEVAYYWQRKDLDRAANLLAARQCSGSTLVLVHFTPVVPDYPMTGDEVHEAWRARPEWRVITSQRCDRYRIDVLERC